MNDFVRLSEANEANDFAQGGVAAELIWEDAEGVDSIIDPRTPAFAAGVVQGLSGALASSPGAIKRMMRSAAAAAEDLNVEQFQGLVEVIQNADDLKAREVRFAFRNGLVGRQLLIVHNGQPVACQHVLGMALPFLTTKTNRTDQRGRFGIGLKTLRRIANGLSIHSHPYHFSGDQLSLHVVDAEDELPGFYVPSQDTLIVLDLKQEFDEAELKLWFEAWDDDGLIFLNSVSSFRWCDLAGSTIDGRTLSFDDWREVPLVQFEGPLTRLACREVQGDTENWTIWRATVEVPGHLHPAHKARSETTLISIAAPSDRRAGDLYIGFKTRVPVDLSFSIDAQFDPSTAREALIENAWNHWLVQRCGDLLAEIASRLLATTPQQGWRFVPLAAEHVGIAADRWLRASFAESFAATRAHVGLHGHIALEGEAVPLRDIAYEDEELSGFLTGEDIEKLLGGVRALSFDARDRDARWRDALDEINVSVRVGTGELLDGFARQLFAEKPPAWWVRAARILVESHDDDDLFGVPIWLADDHRALPCQRAGETAKPLVLGGDVSSFSQRWKLLDRLHPAYAVGEDATVVIAWLDEQAAFQATVDAETELAAFAERFGEEKLPIEDNDLRELRDRFDQVSDRRAEELGRDVGAVLLLDGFVYKAGKVHRQKVSPPDSYLCKTLDSDFPHWPTAAGTLPGIQWIAARYDEQLKTGATRFARKRADGTISRGPRRFLMVLGAETAPRLKATGLVRWGGPTRNRELRAAGAEQVPVDYVSPDLDRVLALFDKLPKRELRQRSSALLKALARGWDRLYVDKKMVLSEHVARVYTYTKSAVTADWLVQVRETPWIAVGKGDLVTPDAAVIKTPDTQTLYASSAFAADVDMSDFGTDFAATLGLVTSVRVSDLATLLRDLREGSEPIDDAQIMQVYRNIAKHVPRTVVWNTRIGDITAQDLRSRFTEGQGLVYVGNDQWSRPTDLLRGKDIFHDRTRFVPGGPAYAALWIALDVQEPSLDDCLQFLRGLATQPYDVGTTAKLIDVYRHMEPLLEHAERKHRERLKALPLYCGNHWQVDRPVILVEDQEVRSQLASALPHRKFWSPPCDLRDLPRFVALTAVTLSAPSLRVVDNRQVAEERGDGVRPHFAQAVDHLSDELARNDPETRQRMSLGWDELRNIPLFVYSGPIAVHASDEVLATAEVAVELQAVITQDPKELHAWEEALPKREYGGHAIASLFPAHSRRGIEAEWVVSWQEGRERATSAIRLASDEEHDQAMQDRAAKINAAPRKKIVVTKSNGRGPDAKPRKLKEVVGPILGATVVSGSPPQPSAPSATSKLHKTQPTPGKSSDPASRSAPTAYTLADLEQRGWELLVQALETSTDEAMIDFRARHGVGADGAIDWKTFVEMKATGRAPQGSVEMSNTEYERAKERGIDFILALVSGLEDDYQDEVRLILDPANRAAVRPLNGVKLVALADAPSIVIQFGKASED